MSNAKIKTTNIKGKQYAEVHERIKHFRGEPNYASLGINTEVLEWDKDKEEIVIRATIYDTVAILVAYWLQVLHTKGVMINSHSSTKPAM